MFVTADPAYDTPARHPAFLDRFDPGFLRPHRHPRPARPVLHRARHPAARPRRRAADGDEVEHAADVYAFAPDGRAYLAYDNTATPAGVRDDLRALLAGRTPAPVADADLVASGGVGRVGLVSVYRAFVRARP